MGVSVVFSWSAWACETPAMARLGKPIPAPNAAELAAARKLKFLLFIFVSLTNR
jgi:hypothetical protein